MKIPEYKTEIVHSLVNDYWIIQSEDRIICTVPYITNNDPYINNRYRTEAFEFATFISTCFNFAHEESISKQPFLDKFFDVQIPQEAPTPYVKPVDLLDNFDEIIKFLNKD